MNAKYLTPLQIEFIHWYIDYLQRKHGINTIEIIGYLRQIINDGWYKEEDSEALNRMVHLHKQQFVWRNTGPVQHKR